MMGTVRQWATLIRRGLSLDQTDLGDRFAILMISLGVGNRALPLAWTVEAGPANLGFADQQVLLERVRAWLPAGVEVLLSADRFYPSGGQADALKSRARTT